MTRLQHFVICFALIFCQGNYFHDLYIFIQSRNSSFWPIFFILTFIHLFIDSFIAWSFICFFHSLLVDFIHSIPLSFWHSFLSIITSISIKVFSFILFLFPVSVVSSQFCLEDGVVDENLNDPDFVRTQLNCVLYDAKCDNFGHRLKGTFQCLS